MQINVTVDGVDGIDLTTVVGDEVAYYNPETEETEHRPRTLGDLVAEKITRELLKDEYYAPLREQVLAFREDEIRRALRPAITEALDSEIRKTNTYGEPTGPATPMRQLIIDQVSVVLHGKNDRYSNQPPLLNTVIDRTVRSLLEKELKEVFAAEKAKVVAAVRARAADLVAEAVKQGLGG